MSGSGELADESADNTNATEDQAPQDDDGYARRSAIWPADGEGLAEIGQEHAATFIAAEVSRDSDIRVAVEGPWGSGKTRVLKLVQDQLTHPAHEDIVVAWYDPWKYSPDETVLRRTLLAAVDKALEDQCPECHGKIQQERFHTELRKERLKTDEELEDEIKARRGLVKKVLKTRAPFYVGFGLVWAALFLAAGWISTVLPTFLQAALPAFVVAAGAAVLAAIIQDAVQSVQIIKLTPNVRMTLPKLDQIDQFEEEYRSVLDCLADEGKDLVILVDDLDRCSKEEIQTVVSGLSTYLETPHERERGHVAFVVAIDEPRVLEALKTRAREAASRNRPRRENVIQKHFHLVVPVPIADKEVLRNVLDATLEHLDWHVNEPAKERMVQLTVAYGDSNLRVLRAAASEAHAIPRYYRGVLEPHGIEMHEELIKNPILRYRIALIRELSDAEALREFLGDPLIWQEKASWPDGIERDLFDLRPRFVRGKLDPRPLLGFSPSHDLASTIPAIRQTRDMLKSGNQQNLDNILEGYQPVALVSLVSLLMSAGIPEDAEDGGKFVTGLIHVLLKAKDALGPQDLTTFQAIIDHLKKHVPESRLQNPRHQEWVEVASAIGPDALDILFENNLPLLEGTHRQGSLNALLELAKRGEVSGRFALQTHSRMFGGDNWGKLHPIALQLIGADQLQACQELHELQIQCMQNWDYSQKPHHPPMDLYGPDLVKGIRKDNNRHRRAASAYKVAANQNHEKTRDFVSRIAEYWPTEAPDDGESRDEDAK